ncbi:MAG: hypothetical protein KGH74_05230 [Candidatus Micrarchaeota archaeon]|nr:hypothetical protein [Candidatus Micrarchaeota archaeon]
MKASALILASLLVALFFAQPVHAQTTVVQACTWFQFQCWAYPFTFFMFYVVVFMMVGALGGASGKGMNVMLLAGLDNAAIAGTAMGMLTPTIPIIALVLTVVYMVRFR